MKKLFNILAVVSISIVFASCYGQTSEKTMKRAAPPGPTGQANMGLVPTMKKLAE